MRATRIQRSGLAFMAVACSLCLVSGCAPAPAYTPSYTPSYTPRSDPTADLRKSSIEIVEKMAELNESVAGKKSDKELIVLAEEAVKNSLKDPGSAQFRDVSVKKFNGGRVVCGEVNAKNSYGGYVGFKEFVGGIATATIESTGSKYPEVDQAANAGIFKACR